MNQLRAFRIRPLALTIGATFLAVVFCVFSEPLRAGDKFANVESTVVANPILGLLDPLTRFSSYSGYQSHYRLVIQWKQSPIANGFLIIKDFDIVKSTTWKRDVTQRIYDWPERRTLRSQLARKISFDRGLFLNKSSGAVLLQDGSTVGQIIETTQSSITPSKNVGAMTVQNTLNMTRPMEIDAVNGHLSFLPPDRVLSWTELPGQTTDPTKTMIRIVKPDIIYGVVQTSYADSDSTKPITLFFKKMASSSLYDFDHAQYTHHRDLTDFVRRLGNRPDALIENSENLVFNYETGYVYYNDNSGLKPVAFWQNTIGAASNHGFELLVPVGVDAHSGRIKFFVNEVPQCGLLFLRPDADIVKLHLK